MSVQIGESFPGEDAEAAHVNTELGPVGTAARDRPFNQVGTAT